MARTSIDLVADIGEGFGNYTVGDDDGLLEVLSSVNLACGFHAGSPLIMEKTVQKAMQNGVAVGAHPGFDDLQNFGRVKIDQSQERLYADTLYQLGACQAFLKKYGVPVHHVTPHGMLGNLSVEDPYYAEPVMQAIHDFDPTVMLYSQTGAKNHIAEQALALGHEVAWIGFPDRNLRADGHLVSRKLPNALVGSADEVAARAKTMVVDGYVEAEDGTRIEVDPDVLLLHGDKPEAVDSVTAIRNLIESHGLSVCATPSKRGLDAAEARETARAQ